jgi:hypothetical protein
LQKIFKVLASIAACVLFLLALTGLIWEFVEGFSQHGLVGAAWFSLWVSTLVLSVVVMKLRQMID